MPKRPERGGGIELLGGFQTKLTGFTVDEARSLFLVGQPLVASPTQQRRVIDLTFASSEPLRGVGPLGLVLKAGEGHLVHTGEPELAVSCLDNLTATRLHKARFSPPVGFDLARFWERHCRTRR